ncbi:hypothetical protein D3C81_876620 [compost metagenome]
MVDRGDHDQFVAAELHRVQVLGGYLAGHDAQVGRASANRGDDFGGQVLLQFDIDIGVLGQEARQRRGQEGVGGRGVGQQPDAPLHALGVGPQVGMHALQLAEYLPRVAQQGIAGRRQAHAFYLPDQQLGLERLLQLLDARAGGGQGKEAAFGRPRQVLGLPHVEEEAQVGQIVVHGFVRAKGHFCDL